MRGQLGEALPLILLILLAVGGGYTLTQVFTQLNSLSQTLSTMKNEIIVSLILIALISYIWKTKQTNNIVTFILFMLVLYSIFKIMNLTTTATIYSSDSYIIKKKPVTQTIFWISNKGKGVELSQVPGERDCLEEFYPNGTPIIYKQGNTYYGKALCFYYQFPLIHSFIPLGNPLKQFLPFSASIMPQVQMFLHIDEYKTKFVSQAGVFAPKPVSVISSEMYYCYGSEGSYFNCSLNKTQGKPDYSLESLTVTNLVNQQIEYHVVINSNFILRSMSELVSPFPEKTGQKKVVISKVYNVHYKVTTSDDNYVYDVYYTVICPTGYHFVTLFQNAVTSQTEDQSYWLCDGTPHTRHIHLVTATPYHDFVIRIMNQEFVVKKYQYTFKLPKLPIQKRKPIKVKNKKQFQNSLKQNSLKSPVNTNNYIYKLSKEFVIKKYYLVTYFDTNDYTNISYILLCNSKSTPYFVLNTNKKNAVNCTKNGICAYIVSVQLPTINKTMNCSLQFYKNGKELASQTYTFKMNVTEQQIKNYKPNYGNNNVNYPSSIYQQILQEKQYLYYLLLFIIIMLLLHSKKKK